MYKPIEKEGKWYAQHTTKVFGRTVKRLFLDIKRKPLFFTVEQHCIDWCKAKNAIDRII